MPGQYLNQDDNDQYLQNFRGFVLTDGTTASPQTLTASSSITLTIPANCYGVQYYTQADSEIDITDGTNAFRIPNGFYQGTTPNQTITIINNSSATSYTIWYILLTI